MEQQKTADYLTQEEKDLISDFKTLFSDASPPVLRTIVKLATTQINKSINPKSETPDMNSLNNLFKYVPNIYTNNSLEISTTDFNNNEQKLSEDKFFEDLKTELDSLGVDKKASNPTKVTTQWVLNNPHDHPDLKSTKDMSDMKCVSMLMDKVNNHDECVGQMTGCIINCFRSSSARHFPHSDNEPYIDQNSSVCTISLGGTREFGIYEQKHKDPQLLRKYTLEPRSMMVMHPGSQAATKHKVLPNRNPTPSVSASARYSISFRRIVPTLTSETKPVIDKKKVVVIFGSSITKYLSSTKLEGSSDIKVINLSASGSKIYNICGAMDSFYTGEHTYFKI